MATITGTSGNDTLTGTSSADTLVGSGGNDFYDGGGGSDTLDFRATGTATIVDFSGGTISGGFNGSFTSIERVLAGNGNDSLIGAAGAQNLSGRGGNDTLEGGAGNDWLWGGGDGVENHFVFRETGTANADQIGDFISGADKIVLDATVMGALGATGNFAAGDARFAANTSGTAQDANDRVIYETDTRQIWYDPDGNGAAARQLIATLQSGATLTATNIVVQGGGTSSRTINGTEGDDTLVGTPGNDTINGLGGNDSISGLDGDDSLSGGDGNDTLDGGNGTDTLDGGLGDDTYIVQGSGPDTIIDAGGVDTLISFAVFVPMPSGIENLTLRGGPFNPGNDIYTSSGNGNELNNRIINERPGSSGLDGGAGDDTLIGSATGMNWFEFSSGGTGNYGNDVVDGNGGGAILLAPGAGVTIDFRTGTMTGGGTGSVSFSNIASAQGTGAADLMIGSDSGVTLYGDAGNDTLSGGLGNDYLTGDGYRTSDAPEFTIGDDSLSGGGGNDTLTGGRGNDTMDGGAGDDTFSYFFETDYGNDSVTGGTGTDLLTIFNLSPVTIDLSAGSMSGGESQGGGSVVFTGIENFTALGVGSRITGDAGANVLVGANGNFQSTGTNANDTINGAAGNDTLTGTAGDDQFVFDQLGTANADHVTDFASGQDAIHLDANVMTQLGASGAFSAGDARFFAAAGASAGHDADDRVVYDTASGNLWYDADGSGSSSAQLIATLEGPAALSATDIFVDNGGAPPPPPSGNTVNGTSGNDTLNGTDGNDTLNGLGGNDELVGSGGTDFYNGGAGSDTLNFRLTSTAINLDFGAGTVSGGFNGTLAGMERVLSGNGNDSLTGSAGADNLSGRGGSDILAGGAGNDWLWGGGGGEENHFVFRETGTANADRIGDFIAGADQIDLDNAAMTALGAEGAFGTGDGRFFAASGASGGHDADDRVIYNTSTGQLYYDDDGSGAHAAQLVATLGGGVTLAAGDITVI